MVTLQVVFLSILSLALASYISKKSLVKPGVCPKKIGRVAGSCISECRNDDECPGDKKCCRINDCVSATYCTMPVFADVGSVRSAAILDDTNTVFGAQSSLHGIGNSRTGIRTDDVESSRRFTQTGGRTSTIVRTGGKGKANSVIDTRRGRSGFDDIGFTKDFGGNLNDRTMSGQSSRGTSFSADGGHATGIGERSFIDSRRESVKKSIGARAGSLVDESNTIFGALNGVRKSGLGIHADNVESSRQFTHTDGRTFTTFKTGVKGKASSVIGTQRSGLDDIGVTQDFGGNLNERTISGQSSRGTSFISKSASSSSASKHMSELKGIRSGLRGLGSVSGTFESIDRGMGRATGMDESSLINSKRESVKKSNGAIAGSLVDILDLQRESGVSGISRSHGTSESILRQLNGGTSTRGRSFIGASASASSAVDMTSGHSTDCHYECGKNKRCPVGKKCVQDGCHNICQIDVSSVDQSTSLIDNIGRSIVRSSQGEFGTRRSSVQGSSSILDDISGRSGGLTRLVSETGISGLTQNGSKKKCRKQCQVDADCHHGKMCITVNNCHMYCRKGPLKNNYKP